MKMSLFIISFLLTLSFSSLIYNQNGSSSLTNLPNNAISKDIILNLVNEARIAGCNCGNDYYPPVEAVSWNELLENAAKEHSEDMLSKRFFSHVGSDGSDARERLLRQGFRPKGNGENIAKGYKDEKSVFQGWMSSPGHCKNIMRARVRYIGVARADDYWAMVLAS